MKLKNMTTPTPDLLDVVACALRLAPSFANEDGEMLFSHLREKFPHIATDAIDVIVADACTAAKSGSLASISEWRPVRYARQGFRLGKPHRYH